MPRKRRLPIASRAAIGSLEGYQVSLDALCDLLLTLVELAGCEVTVPDVHRLELAAVDDRRRFAEQFCAYSITASACASNVLGTTTLSALAVLALIHNSTRVGCSIGKSPGLAPSRILL